MWISIFLYEILYYLVSPYSPLLSNLLNQNLQNVKTPKKEIWECLFNDTLLNFGLRAFKVLRDCANFQFISITHLGFNKLQIYLQGGHWTPWVKILLLSFSELPAHTCMPIPLAPDPIRVQLCVCCLF